MRHDAIAISLYIYLTLVLSPQTFHLVPLPAALAPHSDYFNAITTATLWLGCLVCAVARFWRDDLDGGAIEQFGLLVAGIGWVLYLYAFAQLLPMGWFGTALCGGFLLAFAVQWWLIRRWRTRLHELAVAANGDGR